MTAKDCITGKAKAGKVDSGKAARLVELLDELETEARGSMGPNGAAEAAAVEAEIALARQTRQKKRRVLKQLHAQEQLAARAAAHPERVDTAMLSFFDFRPGTGIAGPNVAAQAQVVRGQAQAHMADFIERFRSRAAGVPAVVAPGRVRARRIANSRNIVRELFGQATNDPAARELANGIRAGLEFLRLRFNQAGGDIPKRQDWGLPQSHNRRSVAAAAKDDWIGFTFDRLDREKMIDLDFGRPMTDAKLRRVLADTYDNIVSDGMIDLKPGGYARPGIIKRRQESRFLVFRDPDAWLAYQERFGDADVFTLTMGHIEVMSRDIALIQVLGPNPEASLRFMENLIDNATAKGAISGTGKAAARLAGRIAGPKTALRNEFAVLTGRLNQPANPAFANVMAANRNILVSAMLGTAWFSALSDLTFSAITARFNGVPAARNLARHLKLFLPGSQADRKLAVRLGFGAQGWASMAIAQERYLGEVIGPEWSKRLADSILRLSFLSPWTQAGRWGFMTEMAGFITDQVGKRFSGLPEPLQRSFARHGISPAEWDLIRATPLWRDPATGAEFLRHQDVIGRLDPASGDTALFTRHFEAANKLQAAILTEAEFAVPSAPVQVRAALTGGTQAGTFWGEVLRSTTLFKTFPVTAIYLHLARAIGLQGGMAKGTYIAHLVIGTAVMGALGEQLSQISKGRDPLTMDGSTEAGRKFWLQALARGGGLGIFGDFLFSDVNRFGGGIGNTLLGPVLGTQLDQATRLTVGNLQELIKEGEARGAGRELIRFTQLMTPGRSLWYAGLAMERLIFDQMQMMIDPKAAGAFRRVEKRTLRERGQRFFSPPGSGFPPERGPDLGAAFGGP